MILLPISLETITSAFPSSPSDSDKREVFKNNEVSLTPVKGLTALQGKVLHMDLEQVQCRQQLRELSRAVPPTGPNPLLGGRRGIQAP